jgi:serine/threonine protein kinase
MLTGKKITKVQNELLIMAGIQSEYVVQYYNSWFENNNTLFIQMECCLHSLDYILKNKNEKFKRKDNEIITPTEFYISNELFRDVLECVNYLHENDPPIIHRDLKPENILVTSGKNRRFIKLADFGLATLHNHQEQSHTQDQGTPKYTAPELIKSRKYDTKSDMFSLGVVAQKLFDPITYE